MPNTHVQTVAVYDFIADNDKDSVDYTHHVRFGRRVTFPEALVGSSSHAPDAPQDTYFAVYRAYAGLENYDVDRDSPEESDLQVTYLVNYLPDSQTFGDFVPISCNTSMSDNFNIGAMVFTFLPDKKDDNGKPFMRWSMYKQGEGPLKPFHGWAKMRNGIAVKYFVDDDAERERYASLMAGSPPFDGLPRTTLSDAEKQRLGL